MYFTYIIGNIIVWLNFQEAQISGKVFFYYTVLTY